jgi:hypothetical protein
MGELVQYENKYYQWVKGDYIGRVETVKGYLDENGLSFIIFESGKRINSDLLLEYLMEVPEYQAKVAEESATTIDKTPINNHKSVNTQTDTKSIIKQKSPIMQLLLNQKTLMDIDINITLDVKIPKKEMINVLRDSFGDEIEDDLYQYIDDQLTLEIIKETVQEKIKKFIKEHYESKS